MGLKKASRVENTLVILKVVVIIIFIAVGLTAIHPANYVPFIPQHRIGTDFGGWQGVPHSCSLYMLDLMQLRLVQPKRLIRKRQCHAVF